MPVPPGQTTDLPTYNITVNDDKPIWVYCGQKHPVSHCGLGMVFAVNCGPDGSSTSFSAFKAAAIAEGSSESTSAYPSSSSAPPSTPVSAPNTETDSSSTGSAGVGNVIKVTVGENATLTYNPPFVTAQIGDIVEFEFRSKNHTATQSTFANPCLKLNNATTGQTGFDSDFQPVASGSSTFPTFNVTVNDTAPIWFYSEKNPISHCAAGMVFAINANESSAKSYEAFLTLAKQTNTSNPASTPSTVSGDASGPANGGNIPKVLNWLGLLAIVVLTVLGH
ncbi:hypothetical protein Clacol_003748 [Clathrus columnatus]|uniref:Cupredoxin n=1 Tax=Clathrus columnatus TaxID=1419009 RepID=A0AAV5A5F6_9AGAM|nr:hypothetical protein Clacol_003748 [Clathrus columnatus]